LNHRSLITDHLLHNRLDRLLEIGRDLVQSEGGVIDINNKQFVLSGGELVEKPPTRRHPEC